MSKLKTSYVFVDESGASPLITIEGGSYTPTGLLAEAKVDTLPLADAASMFCAHCHQVTGARVTLENGPSVVPLWDNWFDATPRNVVVVDIHRGAVRHFDGQAWHASHLPTDALVEID